MKKILSTILTTIMLSTTMVTANCFAKESKPVNETACEISTCSNSKSSKSSKALKVITAMGATTVALGATIWLTNFATDGKFASYITSGLDKTKSYLIQMKDYLLNYCLTTTEDGVCINVGDAFENIKEKLNNCSNRMISSAKDLWGKVFY